MQEQEIAAPEHEGQAATQDATHDPTHDPTHEPTHDTSGGPSRDSVLETLKNVYDPELGLNIVDLGLVYEVEVSAEGDVDIQYTLTTMGCPIGPLIEDQMRSLLAGVPGVGEIRPEMVLRPPWSPEMMSEEAKAALGIF